MLKNTNISRKKVLIALALICLAVIAYAYYRNQSSPIAEDLSNSVTSQGSKVNLAPPTEQELQDTKNHKSELDNEKRPTSPPSQSPSLITPIITTADENIVRAYISGVIEDGGVCTAVFSKDTHTFSKQSPAFGDANTTICEPIQLDRSNFAVIGEWTVTLMYTSTSAQGKSTESKFKVN